MTTPDLLRQQAQALWEASAPEPSPHNPQALLHELQVHQIELELQNQELLSSQVALAQSRALYFDLYDLAPVGYCTVAMEGGQILQANLTLATLLGVARNEVIRKKFSHFISPEDQDVFYQLSNRLQAYGQAQSCELRMLKRDGSPFWVQLDAADPNADSAAMRVTIADITARKKADGKLQASLLEKVALLKEVHHRVNNNLQVITSLLRLEAHRTTVPEAVSVLKTMQGRVRTMAQLHQSLYRSGTFASVDLGAYLGQIATQAFHAHVLDTSPLQLKLSMGSVRVGMDQAIACGLLVNELVVNCLKHGFPNGGAGEVRVALQTVDSAGEADRADGALWHLQVSDTGVGLPPNFETLHNDSLGLKLASDLGKQLGGALAIASPPGTGAVFSVIFPALKSVALVMP